MILVLNCPAFGLHIVVPQHPDFRPACQVKLSNREFITQTLLKYQILIIKYITTLTVDFQCVFKLRLPL